MNKLCECGCGAEVSNDKNKFIRGHSNRSEEVKKKKIETSLKNFGVVHPSLREEVQNKIKETCLLKYGVDNANKSDEVKKKKIETNLKNLGVDNPSKSEEVKKKKIETNLKNLGVDNPFLSIEIQKQIKETNLKKYGVLHPYQLKEIRTKGEKTCLINFGVDNFSKTFEFRLSAREKLIRDIASGLKDGQKFSPRKGKNEISFILELQKYTEYIIDCNYTIISYFPDGYIKELNLVIELDEPWHNCTWSKKHDQRKDDDYKKIGLSIFRVKEKDWLINKEIVILDFKLLLASLNQQHI